MASLPETQRNDKAKELRLYPFTGGFIVLLLAFIGYLFRNDKGGA